MLAQMLDDYNIIIMYTDRNIENTDNVHVYVVAIDFRSPLNWFWDGSQYGK